MAALKNPSHGCMFVSLVHLRHPTIQSRKLTFNNEITSLLHAVQQHMCIVIITAFPRVSQERSCRSCHHNRDTANDRCRSCWIHGDPPWTPILQDRLRSTHQRWVQEAILQELVRYRDLKTINFAISIFLEWTIIFSNLLLLFVDIFKRVFEVCSCSNQQSSVASISAQLITSHLHNHVTRDFSRAVTMTTVMLLWRHVRSDALRGWHYSS